MNDHTVNNWAMGLAVFLFGFLSIGSVLFGASSYYCCLKRDWRRDTFWNFDLVDGLNDS